MTDEHNIGVSSSYDGSLIVWDFDTLQDSSKLDGEHKKPIMTFDWKNSLVVSGDKVGKIVLWYINTGISIKAMKCHEGPVSNIIMYWDFNKSNLIISTGIEVLNN